MAVTARQAGQAASVQEWTEAEAAEAGGAPALCWPYGEAVESRGPRGGRLPDLDALTSITRYESHLHRQFMQCLHELQRVQGRRLGTEATVPVALDVTITPADQETVSG